MGVERRIVRNAFPRMEASVQALKGMKVNVGALEGEHAWLAGIHEYGCRIPVTPKMRAWFHHQGVHLKKSTTVIVIPERSFLRAGFDEHAQRILDNTESLLGDVADGTMSPHEYAKLIGLQLSTKIKEYARNLSSPPNSSFTVQRKGSSNPLVDTGDMINSITYEVEG